MNLLGMTSVIFHTADSVEWKEAGFFLFRGSLGAVPLSPEIMRDCVGDRAMQAWLDWLGVEG